MNPGFRGVAAKLTVFTVVTIIVTIWLASVIGNYRLFSEPYTVKAVFTDATGLLRGDHVKAAGVTVGRVDDIRVENGIAIVEIAIDEGVELPANVAAQIRFRNLIGQRMITLDPEGEPTTDLLEENARIPLDRTDPAFDLTVLFNGLRPLIRSTSPEDINIVSRAVVEALDGRSGQVEGFLANLTLITETIAAKDQSLSRMLKGLEVVTGDLAARDQQLQVTLADMGDFFGDLERTRRDLSRALKTMDEAAGRLERLIRENDENITSSVEDLSTLLDAINDRRGQLAEAIEALPAMLEAVQRVNSYGQWTNGHLVDLCKDDQGTCGTRGTP